MQDRMGRSSGTPFLVGDDDQGVNPLRGPPPLLGERIGTFAFYQAVLDQQIEQFLEGEMVFWAGNWVVHDEWALGEGNIARRSSASRPLYLTLPGAPDGVILLA